MCGAEIFLKALTMASYRKPGNDIQKPHGDVRQVRNLFAAASASARISFACARARARPSPHRVCALALTHPSQTCGQKRLRALSAARLHTACAHGDMRTHAPRTCELARTRVPPPPPTCLDPPSLRVDTGAALLVTVAASAKNYAELPGGAVP